MEKEGMQLPPNINQQRFITSQVEILRSQFSVKKLIDHIGLDKLSSGMSFKEAVRSVQENLSLDVIGHSNIIDIGFRWKDPVICAEVLNTLANLYIQFLNSGEFNNLWKQVEFYKKRLQESERTLDRFKQKWDIDSIDTHRAYALKTLRKLEESLQDTNTEITKIETTISGLNTSHPASGSPGDLVPGELLVAQIDLSALKVKKDSLVTHIKSLTDRLQTLDKKRAEFYRLTKKVEADKEILSRYTERIEEARAAKDMDERNIINAGIIESASIPYKPIKPRWDLNLVLAIIVGLTASMGVAFISEYLDHSFRDEEDVNRYLNLPVLASIPEKKKGISGGKENYDLEKQLGLSQDVINQYQRLKSKIFTAGLKDPLKRLIVLSSNPKEGTTSIVVEFAVTLAKDIKLKILLIDGNLRHPMLHNAFGLEKERGLCDLVAGLADHAAVQKKTGISNLWVITSGTYHNHPSSIFLSKTLPVWIKAFSDMYDYLIFDAPPVNLYSDSVSIASQFDGVILVVQTGKTRWEQAARAKEELEHAGAKILGVVLNKRRYFIPENIYKRL